MHGLKVCFKCGKEKPLDEFYRHPKMGDGRLGKCKECTKADAAEHRIRNLDKVRAYDRARAKLPARRANAAAVSAAWRGVDSRRMRAHNMVLRAISSGKIERGVCEVCGNPKSHGHHDDYEKPLIVRWLCAEHHAQHHAIDRLAIRQKV